MIAAAVTLLAALAAAAPAPAPATTPPPPARWVTDHAGFLSPPVRQALDARLESYERATGHQIVVWIDRTLSGAALDDWAVRTFEAWKPGRKGQDDGIALFIFSEDRKIDIEVGYGLEDEVPDAIAARVIREVMAPRLQAGDRDGAVTAGVDAVLAAIEGRPWTGAPATTATEAERPAWVTWGGSALLAVLALILFIKYPRAAMWLFWMLLASRGRGGGGGIGGGGGFRGGGGRSGGGGARGGW